MAVTYPYDGYQPSGIVVKSLPINTYNYDGLNTVAQSPVLSSTTPYGVTDTLYGTGIFSNPIDVGSNVGNTFNVTPETMNQYLNLSGLQHNAMGAAPLNLQQSTKMALSDKINTGINMFNSGLNAYNSYNATKLAKAQFAHQKDAWNKDYAARKAEYNSKLEDRQAQRMRTHPERNIGVAEYMDKYGVK